MKIKFLPIIFMVSMLLAWSATGVSAGTYLQHGRVVDAENNAPLQGVTVFVGQHASVVELVVTGQDGQYILSNNQTPSANAIPHSGTQTIIAIYHPGYVSFTRVLAADPPSEKNPVIRLNRVTPLSSTAKNNAELQKNIETLTYYYNDRELNPAIKFKLLLKSVPDIELMLERIEWEKIIRREDDIEKDERFSFGREWRDVYDKTLESRLDGLLKSGTSREKLLALVLVPKPRCEDDLRPITQSFLDALSDPDSVVREMAAFYVRSSMQKSNRTKDLPTHISDPESLNGISPVPKNLNVAYGWSRQKRIPESCDSLPIVDALLKATTDPTYRVRMEAALALGYAGEQQAVPRLVNLLADQDPFVRMGAAVALGELRAKDAAAALASLAMSTTGDWRDFFARREALNALRKIWAAGFRRVVARGPKGDMPQELFDENVRNTAVATALKVAEDVAVRREAFGVLAEIKAPEAAGLFRSGARDNDPVVRFNAMRGLLRLADDSQLCRDCSAVFAAAAADTDARVRAVAISGLGRVTGRELNEVLLKALHDPHAGVREAAISSVRSSDSKSLEKLADLLDEKLDIRVLALKALYRATSEDSGSSVRQRGEPMQAKSGGSYLWIEPDSRHKRIKAEGQVRELKIIKRVQNDGVVKKIMTTFPKLTVVEKVYALEIVSRFEQADILSFLLSNIEAAEPEVVAKAMERSMGYAPPDSFPVVVKKLKSENVLIRESAEKIVAGLDIDIPVKGFVWMAEDSDPGIRRKFYSLAKNLSDPLLPPLCLKGLHDPSTDIRKASVVFFQEHPDPRAVIPLSEMLKGAKEEAMIAARALASQDESAFDLLLEIIADPAGIYEVNVKRDALFGIVNHNREKTVSALIQLLDKAPDGAMASDIVRALVGLKARRFAPTLLKLLSNGHGDGSLVALALFTLEDPASLIPLQKIIENTEEPLQKRKWAIMGCAGTGLSGTRYLLELAKRSPELRLASVQYLQIQKPEDRRVVAEMAGENPQEYREIVAAIGGAFYRIPLEATAAMLRDKNQSVVKGAVLLLRATANPKAIEYLHAFENDSDHSLRELVLETVRTLEQKKLEQEQKKELKPGSKRG